MHGSLGLSSVNELSDRMLGTHIEILATCCLCFRLLTGCYFQFFPQHAHRAVHAGGFKLCAGVL